ncbi:LysE family translocator [Rhodococcus sp. SORGH_AS_0301]|uniref:LysE family translocator n=1 Tax=Rhodococcus sp. SORGH_AS_0301 TaxID=3041780 RepID=UPI002786A285|nr:LysE family transporter [Rhodococcus sp. SORGH_AS_0301]MDQ1181847.1 threonine/homoserine/homoserine lactone efflux protein [Rhodococcus sp. SORGH_AS_0301]
MYLGVRALLASRRDTVGRDAGDRPDAAGRPSSTLVQVWRRAFTANVLNPKAALFFVAVLPQFVTPGGPVAAQIIGLGLLDIALGVVWWAVFVLGVHQLRSIMGGTHARTVTDRVAGTALIGLGGVLAAAPSRV